MSISLCVIADFLVKNNRLDATDFFLRSVKQYNMILLS